MKNPLRLLFFTQFLFLVFSVSGQSTVSTEAERLSFFIGRWTTEDSKDSYLEVCKRINGGHIQCVSGTIGVPGDSAVSYLTYSKQEEVYVYYGLSGSGNSRTLRGKWHGDHFLFEGERIGKEKRQWRVTITPVENRLHFTEDVSVNNGEWKRAADFFYIHAR